MKKKKTTWCKSKHSTFY